MDPYFVPMISAKVAKSSSMLKNKAENHHLEKNVEK